MNKILFLFSWVIKILAAVFTYLTIIQIYDILTSDNPFLFFQIMMVVIWGFGALIFWIVGLLLGKSYKQTKKEASE